MAINSGRRMTETKRRIAVRAETTDLEEAFTPPTYPKSEDAKDRIRQGVVQNAQGDGLLKELTAQQKEDMINAMIEVTCKAGDLVIKQGEDGDHFYLVDSGKFEVYLKQSGEKALRSYDPGDSFGELALLYNSARAATVKCVEDGVLWALERKAFRYVMVSDGSRDIAYRAENFLKTVEILSPLTDAQRADLASVGGAVSRRGSAPAPRAHGPAELSRRIPPPPSPLTPSPGDGRAGLHRRAVRRPDGRDGRCAVLRQRGRGSLPPARQGLRQVGRPHAPQEGRRLRRAAAARRRTPRAAARRARHHPAPRLPALAALAAAARVVSPATHPARAHAGESCLEPSAKDAVRKANVVAVGKTVMLKLSRDNFLEQLGPLTELIAHNFKRKVAPSSRAPRRPALRTRRTPALAHMRDARRNRRRRRSSRA